MKNHFSRKLLFFTTFVSLSCVFFHAEAKQDKIPKGWVYLHNIDSSIEQKLDFSTDDNCVGAKLDGYEGNQVICTLALAQELKKAQATLKRINKHYSLLILDAYRPVRATKHLIRWTEDITDTKTKEKCYPDFEKKDLAGNYVAAKRSPHNRGSTVDVIITDQRTGEPLDFGPDFFGDYANIDYPNLTNEQRNNRNMLRKIMLKHNFKPYNKEFWHFTLKNEPFPKTYFDFVIRNEEK